MTPTQALARLRVSQQQERAALVERHEVERIRFLDRQRRQLRDLAMRQEIDRELLKTARPIGNA